MIVYIKDLPIELQDLIHRRQVEQGNDGKFDGDLSNDRYSKNFVWADTPEGKAFWGQIYSDYKNMKSHEFYPKKRVYEIC